MSDKEYQKFIEKYTPKPPILINAITTFVAGGMVGLSSELLLEVYEFFLKIPRKESGILVILTLITISSILTSLGVFDLLVSFNNSYNRFCPFHY